ncbi:apyrase isoform X3 [Plutella xylostella]|uniref:apyrase isoform X1 n=1 Tax=Plutella xylostella TaxID=51655 RepID=UPI0020324E94|nr:apyrase isoform X1 [Plutella xylostella]XP_048482715.1 apyrase isoform X2 [Plutella xylostella]XP_048482716.1 apyrase isoform X3 [Plutella xylostella]
MYEYDIDDRNMKGTLRDWRKALRTPATYRVGNAVRVQPQFVLLMIIVGAFLLFLFYYNWWTGLSGHYPEHRWSQALRPYNATYPLSAPIVSNDIVTLKIGLVADLDTDSKSKVNSYTFNSYFKKGYLSYHAGKNYAVVSWDTNPPVLLTSTYSHKGRGMELSELIVFDGRLLTFDDRSGMVFEILNNKMIPWVILTDGNGKVEKGFKSEWATVKDEVLYVGSMGKEWTTAGGDFQSYDPMWIKTINVNGEVQHLSWINQYKAVRGAVGIQWPGYMTHESAVWSAATERWHFLPRRCSSASYNETLDEARGCDRLVTADNYFSSVKAVKITEHKPKFGFSSFKFVPGTRDEVIVALKTTEFEGKTATYITVFKTDGTVLLQDTFVENIKYEGIEFI